MIVRNYTKIFKFLSIWILIVVFIISAPTSYALTASQQSALNMGALYFNTENTCSGTTPSVVGRNSPGPVFVIGDSIGKALVPSLTSSLPTSAGWSVTSDARDGRPLKEGIDIVTSAPEALKTAKHVLVVLGTNPDSKSNLTGVTEMITAIKAANSTASIYWVTLNVTNPDFTANAETVNEALKSLSGVTLIQNTAKLRDGIHPEDMTAFGTFIASQISSAAAASSTTTDGKVNIEENKKIIFQQLLSYGYTAIQAAGIMGNMREESGFNPQRLQGTKLEVITVAASVPRGQGSKAWGLVQWDPAHKMIDPVTGDGNDPNNIIVQLDFLKVQLEGNGPSPEKRPGEKVRAATTIAEATRAFASYERFRGYEDDNSPKYTSRIASAQEIFDALSGLGPLASSPGGPSSCVKDGVISGPVEVPEGGVTFDQTSPVPGTSVRALTSVVPKFMEMVSAAKSSNPSIDLYPISSGWRDPAQQIALRKSNCGTSHYAIYDMPSGDCSPPTARPGTSNHERGVAFDFGNMCFARGKVPTCSGNPRWEWLVANAGKYGFKQLSSEAWHWSVNGN